MAKRISLLTLNLLFISLFSGFVLLFAYHPNTPYDSVQQINYIVPYGMLFRKIHYFSSEAFFISILLHVSIEINRKITIKFKSWIFSVLALFSVIGLLFSGFILKGDLNSIQAAEVAFSLLKKTPFLDNFLPLIKDGHIFVWKFFIFHSILLPTILIYALFKHIKYLNFKKEYILLAFGTTALLITIFNMPEDISLYEKVTEVSSPWFFLGAENMLKTGIDAQIVNLVLITPFLLLILIYKESYKKIAKILLLIWLVIYVYFSF